MDPIDMENKLKDLEQRVTKLEGNQSTKQGVDIPTLEINDFGKKIAPKIDKISTSNLVMITLFIKPSQSTSHIRKMINSWGWSPDTFFQKNFGSSLVNKGLVHNVGKDQEKNDTYALTEKGKNEIEQVMKKLQLS